jgi:D-inositol-3-phosphate glycosyltransferase
MTKARTLNRRIAIISEHASPLSMLGGVDAGGQNVYVGQVARNLVGLGYEVDVFTRRDNRYLPEIAEWVDGVRVIHVPAGPAEFVRKEDMLPYMGHFTEFMLRMFRRQRRPYSLVHANFWMSATVAADIKRELGTPFVVTFHALGRVRRAFQKDADEFPDERFAAEERAISEADRVIAECPQDEDDIIRLYNADPARIMIVPCGFDPSEFWPVSKPLARMMLGLDPEERVLLQLGRLVPRKGIDNAIRGFARFRKADGGPARLLVVGGESDEPYPSSSPELDRLRGIANEEGVADEVTFVGRRGREALKFYYSAADAFITTPWYEPFGVTPVEAMACGTPVIGSDVGGIKYTVRDGETGYLVPANDPDTLAERLSWLYANPRLRGVLGKRAIRRANDLFRWDGVTQALARVYEEVMDSTLADAPVPELVAVNRGFDGASETLRSSARSLGMPIIEAARLMTTALERGGKIMICGNGGSAADAQHFAGELVGHFLLPDRRPLPALALNTDVAILTALGNDRGYEHVFADQVRALGRRADVLIGMSTSGRSRNLVEAFKVAGEMGIKRIVLTGGSGGDLAPMSDVAIVVPSTNVQHIQETHLVVVHLLCQVVEQAVVTAEATSATRNGRTRSRAASNAGAAA